MFGVVRRQAAYRNLDGVAGARRARSRPICSTSSPSCARSSACRPARGLQPRVASRSCPLSWEQPVLTAEFAAVGVTALLESIRARRPGIRFYQASSSEIFGEPLETPQTERTPLSPLTPYGVAKAYGHFITRSYRRRYGLHASSGILYNHESPRRPLDFLPMKVAHGAAAISLGLEGELWLGDLAAQRDWSYAGDYVRAMWLMLQQDEPDDYVIATRRAALRRGARRVRVRPRRPRLARLRPDRRVAPARQGRVARPRRRPDEGARTLGLVADGRPSTSW